MKGQIIQLLMSARGAFALQALVAVLGMVLLAAPGAADAQEGAAAYKLDAGDLVRIQVLHDEDLGRELRLESTGTVSFPLIGQVKVNGLTVREFETLIADKLRGRFFDDPKVTVTVLEYRPFYVNGEVEKPGSYPYQPGLTVRKAISVAGGLKERASRRKIFLIREKDPDSKPAPAGMDMAVGPGDILTVEQSFF